MLGSKRPDNETSDHYSKLIDLVSKPEALAKRLDELKQATQYHQEVYDKAMLAREQTEDANKQLNERADVVAQQLLARERSVKAREDEATADWDKLGQARATLDRQVIEQQAYMQQKELQYQEMLRQHAETVAKQDVTWESRKIGLRVDQTAFEEEKLASQELLAKENNRLDLLNRRLISEEGRLEKWEAELRDVAKLLRVGIDALKALE